MERSVTEFVTAESVAEQGSHAPRVVLPSGTGGFSVRASRFRQLAPGHAMADFLRLMGDVSGAQSWAVRRRSAESVASCALAASREHGMPPLNATMHARSSTWTRDLHDIVEAMAPLGRAREALATVMSRSAPELDEAADRLLAGASTDEEGAEVPFIGAALQVYFGRLAATLQVEDLEQCDVPTLCPVCGSRPVASVVRAVGSKAGLRYLVCGLCATEWNLPRIKCSYCEEDRGLQYFGLEAAEARIGSASWRAEACDECRTYLKIFYQDKDPQADPVADDLASLVLDMLLDERGYSRSGPNFLFHPGTG